MFLLNLDETKNVSDHFPIYAFFYTNRDTDNSMTENVTRLIRILKVCAGLASGLNENLMDINNDNQIGIEEAIYFLQLAAGMRAE